MMGFLHERQDFDDLVVMVGDLRRIHPSLVEKDYWIMHALWGLQAQDFSFQLKGGTSLSKGYGIIHRFSEDIDIRIEPPSAMAVKTARNQNRPTHVASRARFYEWLCTQIAVPGFLQVERDTAFDDERMRSAGIRMIYPTVLATPFDLKHGILLEPGFDDTVPNKLLTISSWAYDFAAQHAIPVIDNRAHQVACYLPAYTFVEKLQTISTKYRQMNGNAPFPSNILRHYYDVFCLLDHPEVIAFIATPSYEARKSRRFRAGDELRIAQNPAFTLVDSHEFAVFEKAFHKTAALYYGGQPAFAEIMGRIREHLHQL